MSSAIPNPSPGPLDNATQLSVTTLGSQIFLLESAVSPVDEKDSHNKKEQNSLSKELSITPQEINNNEQVTEISKEIRSGTRPKTYIQTMFPYNPMEHTESRHKRNYKKKMNPYIEEFEKLFGPEVWNKYLTMKTQNPMKAAEVEYHLLKIHPTKNLTFRRKNPSVDLNTWLIETTTQEQTEAFLKLNQLGKTKVEIKSLEYLNTISGTVLLSDENWIDNIPDEDYIKNSLNQRGHEVKNVKIYKTTSRNTERTNRIANITFTGQTLPQKVCIEGIVCTVRPHVPKPLQCGKCSKFGHLKIYCRNQNPRCAFCASQDHHDQWNCGTPKCINCGEEHHSRAKTCKFYQYNTELKLLRNRSILSVNQAKQELEMRGFKDPAKDPQIRQIIKINQGKTEENTNQELSKNIPQHKLREWQQTGPNDTRNKKTSLEKYPNGQQISNSSLIQSNQFDALMDLNDCEETEDNNEKESEKENVTKEVRFNSENTSNVQTQDLNQKLENQEKENSNGKNMKSKEIQPVYTIIEETPLTPSPVIVRTGKRQLSPDHQKNEIDHTEECQCIECMTIDIEKTIAEIQKEKSKEHKSRKLNIEKSNKNLIKTSINKKDIVPQINESQSQTSDNQIRDQQMESEIVDPSPILGARGGLINHDTSCGCHNCFLKISGNPSNLNEKKLQNIIEIFTSQRKLKQFDDPKQHDDSCLCVYHIKENIEYNKETNKINKEPQNNEDPGKSKYLQTTNIQRNIDKDEKEHKKQIEYHKKLERKSKSAVNLHNLTQLT